MRKQVKYIVILILLSACKSYYQLSPLQTFLLAEKDTVEYYEVSDFKVYTFNICEYYSKRFIGAERFVSCPDNFFEISKKDSLSKVEELYFLKHNSSDLVLYMTTFSHQYIRKQKGFLNDSSIYKNKFYLSDLENIYVGKINASKDSVRFDHQKDNSKMIWHLPPENTTMGSIEVKEMNVETVENSGNFDEKIKLDQVFAIPFTLKPSTYHLYDIANNENPQRIESFCIINNKRSKKEMLLQRTDSVGFRYPASKVPYYTKD